MFSRNESSRHGGGVMTEVMEKTCLSIAVLNQIISYLLVCGDFQEYHDFFSGASVFMVSSDRNCRGACAFP